MKDADYIRRENEAAQALLSERAATCECHGPAGTVAKLMEDAVKIDALERGQAMTAPQPQAAGEELARLREIEHRVWHLLDASCEDSVGTELTIDLEVAGDDYQKLLDLMPEAHPAAPSSPAPANESPVDSHSFSKGDSK